MITVILKEGLGNQLFQYAAGRSLAKRLGTKLQLDISSFNNTPLRVYALSNFNTHGYMTTPFDKIIIRLKYLLKGMLSRWGFPSERLIYQQKNIGYDPYLAKIDRGVCIEGYWQSEKNFVGIEQIIRNEFVVKIEPDQQNINYLNKINLTNSVSLHIRRGDYVNVEKVSSKHGVCPIEYYYKAIEYISSHTIDPCFFIFSDDIKWVKANLKIDDFKVEYISHNKEKDYEDLRLMYSCKHNILANSSFSWWAAWLNKNKNKIVIAPNKWFADETINTDDLIPDNWIKI